MRVAQFAGHGVFGGMNPNHARVLLSPAADESEDSYRRPFYRAGFVIVGDARRIGDAS